MNHFLVSKTAEHGLSHELEAVADFPRNLVFSTSCQIILVEHQKEDPPIFLE